MDLPKRPFALCPEQAELKPPYAFSLAGQTALVTGAAKGLGRECALALAGAGANVALGLRDLAQSGDIVAEVEALGVKALPLQMDIFDLEQIRAGVLDTHECFGHVDILVNNVGGSWGGDLEGVTEEHFDWVMHRNVKGALVASQEALKFMRTRQYGRIVNMSSQAGSIVLPGDGLYCMAKAALNHLTKCMAVEWGQYGVTVNAVAPTYIWTPGCTPYLTEDPARQADILERISALHRIGEPFEVASAVVFLCSRESSLITGTTMLIDGGYTLR